MSWGASRNVTSDEITSRPDLTSMNRIIGNAESRKCGKLFYAIRDRKCIKRPNYYDKKGTCVSHDKQAPQPR